MAVSYRPALFSDAEELDAGLRAADRDEVTATSGTDTLKGIRRSILRSEEPVAAYDDLGLLCVFGTVDISGSYLSPVASPWFLGTDRISLYPRLLIADARRYVVALQRRFPLLVNYIDARNTTSMKWLNRLGFKLDSEPVPYGVAGLPFYRFERRANV